MADQLQPIIIKKVKKGGGGHGGGAWKIAYADFVTAMMAFFLLLWLLNSVTQEQLEGISNYFAPVSTSKSTSGAGDILSGKTLGEEGVMEQSASRPSVTVDLPPPKSGATDLETNEDAGATEEQLEEVQAKKEEAQFEEAEDALNKAIQGIPQLKQLADSLLIDNTPEGLRIQLVDQEGLAMFPSGGSEMYLHTRKVLELVAKVINEMPQQIAISGHTDATKFVNEAGYSNWELSADRANNARRVLKNLHIPEERIARIVSRAATEPLMPEDPTNARNRRLSIVLLRGTSVQTPPAKAVTPPGEQDQTAPREPTQPEAAAKAAPLPEPVQSGIGNEVQK